MQHSALLEPPGLCLSTLKVLLNVSRIREEPGKDPFGGCPEQHPRSPTPWHDGGTEHPSPAASVSAPAPVPSRALATRMPRWWDPGAVRWPPPLPGDVSPAWWQHRVGQETPRHPQSPQPAVSPVALPGPETPSRSPGKCRLFVCTLTSVQQDTARGEDEGKGRGRRPWQVQSAPAAAEGYPKTPGDAARPFCPCNALTQTSRAPTPPSPHPHPRSRPAAGARLPRLRGRVLIPRQIAPGRGRAQAGGSPARPWEEGVSPYLVCARGGLPSAPRPWLWGAGCPVALLQPRQETESFN